MQDVSNEPLMLWLPENLSSKLGYFQPATPSPLLGSCIYRKAINKDKHLSSGVLPSRQQYHIVDYPGTPPSLVYQVTHGTALQAAECYVQQLCCGDRLVKGLR